MGAGGVVPLQRIASGIHDANVASRFEGVFAMGMGATIPDPGDDCHPKKTLANMRLLGRVGTLGIGQARLDEPRMRATSLDGDLISHIYEAPRHDWTEVAQHCGAILAVAPFHVGCAVERGNALARLRHISSARAAWATAREFLPPDPTAIGLTQLDPSIVDGRRHPVHASYAIPGWNHGSRRGATSTTDGAFGLGDDVDAAGDAHFVGSITSRSDPTRDARDRSRRA